MELDKWFVGGIGLVRRSGGGDGDQWLSLWNPGRGCYHFIETHKLDDETFRQSLQREIAWATGLQSGRDYLISSAPRAHLNLIAQDACGGLPTGYVVEFFLVELMGRNHAQILEELDNACWLSDENIREGAGPDGRPLCPQLLSLLRHGDLMPAWRASP